jgi:hypothetical protein
VARRSKASGKTRERPSELAKRESRLAQVLLPIAYLPVVSLPRPSLSVWLTISNS